MTSSKFKLIKEREMFEELANSDCKANETEQPIENEKNQKKIQQMIIFNKDELKQRHKIIDQFYQKHSYNGRFTNYLTNESKVQYLYTFSGIINSKEEEQEEFMFELQISKGNYDSEANKKSININNKQKIETELRLNKQDDLEKFGGELSQDDISFGNFGEFQEKIKNIFNLDFQKKKYNLKLILNTDIQDQPGIILYYLREFNIRQLVFFEQERQNIHYYRFLKWVYMESYNLYGELNLNQIIFLNKQYKISFQQRRFYQYLSQDNLFFEDLELFQIRLQEKGNEIQKIYDQDLYEFGTYVQQISKILLTQKMTDFYAKEDLTILSDYISKQEQKTMNCLEFEEQVEKLNKDYQIISQFEKIDDQQKDFDLYKWNKQFRWDRLIQFDEDKLLQDISSQDIIAYVKYYFILLANVLTLQSIGVLIPLYNLYVQTSVQGCKQWYISKVIKNSLIALLKQAVLILIQVPIIFNLIQFNKLEEYSQNLTIYMIYQFFFTQVIMIGLFLTQYVSRSKKKLQADNVFMEDINRLKIGHQTFFIEFLSDFQDPYMKKLIPAVPANSKLANNFGLCKNRFIDISQNEKQIQKKWVSAQFIHQRYVNNNIKVSTKNKHLLEQIEKKYGKQQFKDKQVGTLIIVFFMFLRIMCIPYIMFLVYISFDVTNQIATFYMTIIQGTIFYMFTFQINNYERQEKTKGNQRLQKVINMISYKEVEGHVREIPVVNFVDITTMESWQNIFKLTLLQINKYSSVKDVLTTFYALYIIIMLIVLILDIFGAFWEKYTLFHPYFFLIFIYDLIYVLMQVIQDLYMKVHFNLVYDIIIREMDEKIALISDIKNNISEILHLQEKGGVNQEQFRKQQSIQDYLVSITMYQLKRHAKLRLILQGKDIDKIEMKSMEKVTSSYAKDLLSKYEQIKRETIFESENNCQKFLGLIKVDQKLIKQIFATLIIASVSAGGQSLISWLQSRSN